MVPSDVQHDGRREPNPWWDLLRADDPYRAVLPSQPYPRSHHLFLHQVSKGKFGC